MKTILSGLQFAGGLFLAVVIPSIARSQPQTGYVKGRVSNEATKDYLQNAIVTATGPSRSTTTDQQGNFGLGLPPGEASLTISYPGLDSQTIKLFVIAGETVTRDVSLTTGIYQLETFVVASDREGNAKAIAMQRMAPNVKNVVASDSFGNVADGNVGDFLQQLPGVNAVYVGADVRAIQIRGIHEALNSVTMDGARMASAPSLATERTFEFEQLSLGQIETIELTKSPTPDIDADSIGGSVNVVTKSAFDRAQPRNFTYSIGGVFRPKYYTRSPEFVREPIPNVGPSMSFSYSDVLGPKKNIGVLLTYLYHSQPGGDTAALLNHEFADAPERYIHSVQVPRPAGAPRTRLALGAKVDYQYNRNIVVTLNTFLNYFHENNDTRIFTNATSRSAANFKPGYTNTFQEVIANANSFATVLTTTDDKFGRTYGFAPSVRHRYPGMEIDYGATYSNSITQWEMAPNDRKSVFGSPIGHSKGLVSATVRNIGYTIDRTESLQWPVVTQTAGLDRYDLNNYSSLLLVQGDKGAIDTVMQARLNFKKHFEMTIPFFIKAGVQYREQERTHWSRSRTWNYIGMDGAPGTGDDNSFARFLDTSSMWTDANAGYRQPPWLDSYRAAEDKDAHPERWKENLTTGATNYYSTLGRKATEGVSSAYIMGQAKFGGLSILTGVRFEKTAVTGEGPRDYVSPEETARRAAYNAANSAVNDEEAVRRVRAQYSMVEHSEGEYSKVFPGIHFKYEPRRLDGLAMRLSWSTGIGRPNFNQIIPITVANDISRSVTSGNPNLRPQFANNFDATIEYYFNPAGFVSAGVFLKEVDDFIFTRSEIIDAGDDNGFDGQFAGYTWRFPDNAGSGRYRGFEFSYNQRFTFLPGFWRGLALGLNYTKTDSYGDFGGASATSLVARVIPNMVNMNLSYRYDRFDVRVTGIWRDTHLLTSNASEARLIWSLPKIQLNIKTKYMLSPKFGFFFDVENINRSPIRETYMGPAGKGKVAAQETRIVAPKFIAGITGRF